MIPLNLLLGPVVGRVISAIPVKLLIYVLIAVLCAGVGWYLRDGKAQEERLQAVSRAIEQARLQQEMDMAILEESVEIQREIRIRYVPIKEKAEAVAIECTGDTDGWLRVYNDAIRASGSTTPYQ